MMSIAPPVVRASPTRIVTAPRLVFLSNIWQAPLVPIALAGTAGIVLDRHFSIPLAGSLLAAAVFLVAWGIGRLGGTRGLALAYLWLSVGAIGAAYHQWYRELLADDDISHSTSEEPRLARLRGEVASEPVFVRGQSASPLRAFPGNDSTRVVLRVHEIERHGAWETVSGQASLVIPDRRNDVTVGARIEVMGQMAVPAGPANPGEFDYAAFLRDQGIGVLVVVRKSADGIILLAPGRRVSLTGVLAHIRAWGNDVLRAALPDDEAGLASALLLGDGSAMTTDDWDKYLKTGVIHVLAISGQHLAVLGAFALLMLRVGGMGRRSRAITVALFLLGYALLTGGRPPVMRSAWMVLALCGGMIVQRPVLPANSFALAWIIVAAWNPSDIFTAGCQLSFLAVAVLMWGTSGWASRDRDPLEQLIDESRP